MCSVRTEVKRSLVPYSTRESSPALKIMHTCGEGRREGGREGGRKRRMEGGREGEREGGREGGREEGWEEGREIGKGAEAWTYV